MADLNTQIPIPNAPMLRPGTGILVKAWYDFFAVLFQRTGGPTNDANVLLDTLGSVRGGMLSRFATGWAEFEATVANTVPVMNPGALTDVQLKTISQLLDFIGFSQGDILYRDAAGWAVLAPVATKFLKSNGAGAPSWDVPATTAAFKANKGGTDQTGVVSATPTAVTWSTEVFDTGGFFAANAWAPPAGLVRLYAIVQFTVNVVDQAGYVISIQKDAVAFAQKQIPASGTGLISVDIDTTDNASGANVYTVSVTGNGAGNKTISGDITLSWFEGNLM